MWKDLVRQHWPEHEFFSGSTVIELDKASAALGVDLPTELRELLLESDGIHGPYELGLIWPLRRIVEDNIAFRRSEDFRELYMSFADLVFFADAGNGDQFAFSVQSNQVRKPDIYAWIHENDSRVWVASSLRQYIEWWATGKIEL